MWPDTNATDNHIRTAQLLVRHFDTIVARCFVMDKHRPWQWVAIITDAKNAEAHHVISDDPALLIARQPSCGGRCDDRRPLFSKRYVLVASEPPSLTNPLN